jgi:Skp family chaperone for outer membrane proteins
MAQEVLMIKKTSLVFLAAGIVSLMAFGNPNSAEANARNRQKKLDQAAHQELRKDYGELQRDRADLSGLYRSGASRSDIYRKKAEIRDDWREIGQDRQQIYRGDRYSNGYGNDGRYGSRDRYDNSGWNWGNGWWGNRERDRWR